MEIKGKVQPFTVLWLCTGRTAHTGSRGIALHFHDHGTRTGEESASRQSTFYPGKDPVPIVEKFGWEGEPVWTGAENFAHTGIPFPARPPRCQSLY